MSRAPYPGLRPFVQGESDIFFGREEQCDQLIDKLSDHRFVAVVGPSGCGKSSLVKAGLISNLSAGYMGTAKANWKTAKMRPGRWPLKNLSQSIAGVLAEDPSDKASFGIHYIFSTLRRAIDKTGFPDNTNLLILADQFEEIFRLSTEGSFTEASAFVSLLLDLARQKRYPVYVVITMRTDYIGDCTLFNGLPEAINQGLFLTPRLNQEQLHDAIVGPARVFNGDVDYLLVDRLLKTVGPDPDQLPLMQHVLMRTYDHVTGKTDQSPRGREGTPEFILTLEAYERVGGLHNALSKHANEAYGEAKKLASVKETTAEHVVETLFRCLSIRDKGQRDIRNPAKISHVVRVAGFDTANTEDVAGVMQIVEIFLENNIITLFADEPGPPGQPSVLPPGKGAGLTVDDLLDISHESLIRQWDEMCGRKDQGKEGWVNLEAKKAETYRRLAEDAAFWDAQDKDKKSAYLAEKRALDHALAWRNEEHPNEHWARKYDRPLANQLSKELRQMYDTVLANRQDEDLYNRYKQERDAWCLDRFNLTMAFLEQSKKKRDRNQRVGNRIRLAAAMGIIFLFITGGITAFMGLTVYLPKERNDHAGMLAQEAEGLTVSYDPEKIKQAVAKYYEAILYSPDTFLFYIRLADLYLSLHQLAIDDEPGSFPACGGIAADSIQAAQTGQLQTLRFYALGAFLHYPLDRKPERLASCLEMARKNYAKAVSLDDENIKALNGLASVYMKLGATTNDRNNYTLAKDNFEKTKSLDPDNIEALNGLGSVHMILENFEAARTNYMQALASLEKAAATEHLISAYKGIAKTHMSDGNYPEAIGFYEKSLFFNPEDVSVLNEMGHVHSKIGQGQDAIGYYEKARNLYIDGKVKNPLFKAGTYYGLGAVYTKQGRFDRAAIAYKRAAEINPDDPIGENGLGTVWLGRNGFNKAKKHFDRALARIPDHRKGSMLAALVYIGKGYACQGIGDAAGSRAAFARAYEINGEAEEIFYRNNKIIFARDRFPLERIRADGFKDFLLGNKGKRP